MAWTVNDTLGLPAGVLLTVVIVRVHEPSVVDGMVTVPNEAMAPAGSVVVTLMTGLRLPFEARTIVIGNVTEVPVPYVAVPDWAPTVHDPIFGRA
jgi:hypothetical protein